MYDCFFLFKIFFKKISLLSQKSYGVSPIKSSNSFQTQGHVSFPVRYYSQKTLGEGSIPNKWIVAFILFGSASVAAVYKAYYRDQEEGFIGTETPIIANKKPSRFPSLPESIPDEVPYLIIGGGTAAFAAFRAIKSSDPTAKVLVVTNESHYPYMRPPLTKELIFNKSNEEGDGDFSFIQWNGKKRSVFFEPEEFYMSCEELISSEYGGVAVARGWKIKHLDHNNKHAILEGGRVIKYDKCLLATGSYPKQLPIFSKQGPDLLKKVLYYRYLDDFLHLESIMSDETKSVAIIGGSFSGTELAGSLARRGVQVVQIFKEENLLAKILPEYLAQLVTNKIKQGGVNVINNANVVKAELVDNKVHLTTSNGDVVTADHVIVASGVVPNTTLARGAGIEVDKKLGGYVANAEFEVRRDLYAAGDCVSYYDTKFGRRRIEHHDHAVLSGRVAGENMTGKGKTLKTQSMFWCDIVSELGFEAVGIVDSSLPTVAVGIKDTNAEIEKPQTSETVKKSNGAEPLEFDRGVVFYLKNNIVVGMVLWNLYNRVSIARRVLKSDVAFDDLTEVAKHFKFH
ncbi:putative apoptosis-inducing factor 1, mitochondrial isoform X2 [Halyomorpha halys]|uniref:putative apoptosis-inducing factor 1, mitochondrial isoform X2 n=1 Tax=Halyomorpha halys TaxID=286706 RepID=UPI0006D4F4D6